MEAKWRFVIAIFDTEAKENKLVFGQTMGTLIDNAKTLMVRRLGVNNYPETTQSLSELEEQFQGRFILSAYEYLE